MHVDNEADDAFLDRPTRKRREEHVHSGNKP